MRRTVILLALLALALPAYGQDTDTKQAPPPAQAISGANPLKDLLSGATNPLSLKLKDLNSDWRRLTISGQFDMGGIMQMFSSMFGGAGGNTYYTNGQMVSIGNETYIVAYHVPTKPGNFMAMIQGGPNAKPPAPEKLTPDTPLSLSLLNLRTSGSLTDIRPFDLNQEIADSGGAPGGEGAAAANGAGTGNVNTAPVGADTTNAGAGSALNSDISLSNLKQLGQALKDYAQDNNATLPPMQDMSAVKQALMPYLKDEAKFTNPRTNEPYQINTILTQHKVGHIINPTEMVTFYEATPGPDNTRGFVTLDGQVHRAPETEWPLWKKRSKMQ